MAYYAVKEGKEVGIYSTWAECEAQVKGYSGAKYKKFKTENEALEFINGIIPKEVINKKDKKVITIKTDEQDIDFQLDESTAVSYVDGSFNLGDFSYSYGVVFFTKDGKETFSGRDNDEELASMRNVSGELKGAMVAMEVARDKKLKKLYLHYDYMGIEEWALGRWKTNKDGTKKYKQFFDEISKDLEVSFIKVKAHTGVKYNEEADKLAKDAL